MRWPSFLARRPSPAPVLVDPLTRCEREITEAVERRRKARLAKPPANEAQRFARARPMLDQLRREIATAPVRF